ncbi:MAG: hypothetical protein UY48_C0006G0024 [Candidatus Gottesmanbacteria bacterium GW2011_GWB1_49_7]|uniref:Uncharacterized protein n=1 Tax=Candidatus Gottesmanbacteria bacterium GW2011_GWB1_49_7 TaxID=1618448 RepID=A0A0G1W2I4_9BACT|nr:MAG: hypothetical protein UY48_C0006G0024 [Candidatus Gottesmanbacteria bacterium GW2011_GWB1_49_7]
MKTAYLIATLDTSVCPPIVVKVNTYSEANPTVMGRMTNAVLLSVNGSDLDEAFDTIEVTVRNHPSYAWVKPYMPKTENGRNDFTASIRFQDYLRGFKSRMVCWSRTRTAAKLLKG